MREILVFVCIALTRVARCTPVFSIDGTDCVHGILSEAEILEIEPFFSFAIV
jgi:putative component of membrane protein insertase Oxa1/YidC/SpoIIIJ protein YidD